MSNQFEFMWEPDPDEYEELQNMINDEITQKIHLCERGQTPIDGMIICKICGRDIEPI